MLSLEINNAVPEDTIRLRLDSAGVRFAPGPFIGRAFAGAGGAPAIELITVDPDEITIVLSPGSRRHNPGAVDFELTLALDGRPSTATFALFAEAFEGTEIDAGLPGLPPRRLALGSITTLPYTLRESELVTA